MTTPTYQQQLQAARNAQKQAVAAIFQVAHDVAAAATEALLTELRGVEDPVLRFHAARAAEYVATTGLKHIAREAVAELRDADWKLAEIGSELGISHQAVSLLTRPPRTQQ